MSLLADLLLEIGASALAPSSDRSVTHHVQEEAVLVSFSDHPIQEALYLCREERRDA